MELLYSYEHLSCFNYEKKKKPSIEYRTIVKGEKWENFPVNNQVAFTLKGSICFSFGEYVNRIMPQGKVMILPAGSRFKGEAMEDCTVVLVQLYSTKQLCDCFSLDLLLRDKIASKPGLHFLDINERIADYLSFLTTCINDGLRCTFFFELKIKELYFLFRAYYSKAELSAFFHPILSLDISFSEFIIKNHYKAKTVTELAHLTHYSLSGFQKRFRKAFGASAYQWMKEERSKSIFHQINSTEKSFKEISDEFGFSSPSHFNDFCKTHFGATPGKIRKQKDLTKRKVGLNNE